MNPRAPAARPDRQAARPWAIRYGICRNVARYIPAGTEVYEGMVIGNTSKGDEMAVNPTKNKNLTNVRSSSNDEALLLTPPLELTIERGLEIMNDDEYLEITPKSVRLRKMYLTETERSKVKRQS